MLLWQGTVKQVISKTDIWLHAFSLSCWLSCAPLIAPLSCQVILNRSVGRQLMKILEVIMAKASRQLEGDLTVMLKISPWSISVPSLRLFALCVCVCVLPAGLTSQHQTLTSQSLWAGERRRCQDVQHQKVSTMSSLIYSYLLIKNKTKKKQQKAQGILKWLLQITADISGQLRSTDNFGCEKALMWRKVMVDFRSQHRKLFV